MKRTKLATATDHFANLSDAALASKLATAVQSASKLAESVIARGESATVALCDRMNGMAESPDTLAASLTLYRVFSKLAGPFSAKFKIRGKFERDKRGTIVAAVYAVAAASSVKSHGKRAASDKGADNGAAALGVAAGTIESLRAELAAMTADRDSWKARALLAESMLADAGIVPATPAKGSRKRAAA